MNFDLGPPTDGDLQFEEFCCIMDTRTDFVIDFMKTDLYPLPFLSELTLTWIYTYISCLKWFPKTICVDLFDLYLALALVFQI